MSAHAFVCEAHFLVGLRRWRYWHSPCLLTTPPLPAGPGASAINEPAGIPAGFRVVWADEFDVPGLPDTTKWNCDTERNFAGWHNNGSNYSDLPLFDILFVPFRNPKEFVNESGFYDGASAQVPQILVFKDFAGSDFDPAMRLGRV